jgi:putative oxidoreductase
VDLALLLVRLLGFGFAAHGAQKLFGWFGGYGLAGTGGFFESIGFKPGRAFALLAGVSEFVGGLLIGLGLFGPIGAMLIMGIMTTAVLSVHIDKGLFAQDGGYELNLAYMAIALVIAIVGPGAYSLDALLGTGTILTPAISWGLVIVGVLGGAFNMLLRRKPVNQPAGN